jgi:RNA polymerase sigma factor (sigma-70 family)
MTTSNRESMQQVLAEGEWLQRLALGLAHDQADADDVVQETWLAALRAPPHARGSMRPWLARVLRNAHRKLWRGDSRRRRREVGASSQSEGQEVASTDALLARLELQRMVAAMVRDLDEPYRTALLLRFFDGQNPADMALSLGIPAGTVRWRLNEGLRRVRAQLDQAHGGDREAWKAALLIPPLAAPAGPPSPRAAARSRTPAAAGPASSVPARVAGLALLPALVAGLLIALPRPKRPDAGKVSDRSSSTPAQAPSQPMAARQPDDPRMGQLLGVVVPALVTAADTAAADDRWPSAPACNPADNPEGCVQLIPRDQLPPAAEATLVRLLAGRVPEKLKIEPKLRKGHTTYKARFEVDGVGEEIDFAADGTFIEHQLHLPPGDLPATITAAATAPYPEGTIVRATMNNEGEVSFYELVDGRPHGALQHRPANRWYGVRVRVGEHIHDLKLAEDGKLLEDKLR